MEKGIFNENCAATCPHAAHNSELRTTSADSGSVALEADGTLSYISAGRCGIRAGRVGAALVANQDPSLYTRIADCAGRIENQVQVPRRILGLLGMKKTITVVECGAVSKEELLGIAFADAES